MSRVLPLVTAILAAAIIVKVTFSPAPPAPPPPLEDEIAFCLREVPEKSRLQPGDSQAVLDAKLAHANKVLARCRAAMDRLQAAIEKDKK